MFLSKDDLKLAYGVDMEIGKFFVDRKVPPDNSYWQKRLLYIVPQPGYIFIPIYTDLAYRIGITKSVLLGEEYITLMEAVMNSAANQEKGLITMKEHIDECMALAKANCRNKGFFERISLFFRGEPTGTDVEFGTAFPSLNRAHAYLFSLCAIAFDEIKERKLVDGWNALMTYFLIKDDLADIRDDIKNDDHNALIEAGLNDHGAALINAMIDKSYRVMSDLNPVMANRIDHTRLVTDVNEIITSFLKEKNENKKKQDNSGV